jgi:uncharacterized protein YbjT (DUF2867 family)
MKIVVIGGSGLIGSRLVNLLRAGGHEVLAASRSTGVNTLTGEGLAGALAGAAVVVDVANSPSFEDRAVLEFFETAGRNIHAAEKAAAVGHHVALSVVGTDRLQASGYFRAKFAQEKLIKASGIPYTIVRATQFFEFVGAIADSASLPSDGEGSGRGEQPPVTIRVSPALMQPIAADDVAAILADIAVGKPLNSTIDIAGPEPIRMDDLVRQYLAATSRSSSLAPRPSVITDPNASYFGTPVTDESLTPGREHRRGPTRFRDWLMASNQLFSAEYPR